MFFLRRLYLNPPTISSYHQKHAESTYIETIFFLIQQKKSGNKLFLVDNSKKGIEMNKESLDYQNKIRRVHDYIHEHITEDISLETLAQVANFSNYHFHRFFCGMVGETVASYIRRLKLEYAAASLKNTNKRVTDIAFDAGYSNLESFSRAFKKRFGLLPSDFRKENKVFKQSDHDSLQLRPEGENVKVEVKRIDERKLAYVRHIGPYVECKSAWEKLCAWAGPKGLLNESTSFLGLSYDDPDITDADKIRYDASILLNRNVEVAEGIGTQTIAESDYAVCIHKGPYEKLNETYKQICSGWLSQSGREVKNAPSIEIYLNDPCSTPPEELLTEIQIPLT